jgi:hypothetical protein
MTDIAERLYHKNRTPLHLVLDEADAFVMVPTNWTEIIVFLVGSLTLDVPVAMPPRTRLG